jgi:DNA-binding transcriptional LysR family regulator
MKRIPLHEFAAERGQSAAASALGVSPPAITKALNAGREIIVTVLPDGSCSAQELRPFPSQSKRNAA